MGEITYSVSIGSTYTDLKGGATFTATITRDSTPPNDAYPVSADIRFTSLTLAGVTVTGYMGNSSVEKYAEKKFALVSSTEESDIEELEQG